VVVATGVTSVATQIAVLREFLTLFNGNEFTVSIILFSWLFIGGLGTMAAHYAGPRLIGKGDRALVLISSLLGAGSIGQIIIIRILFSMVFLKGTSQGFYPTFFFILMTTLLYCSVLGFILPFTFQVIHQLDARFKGAYIYLADNIGDTLGGVVFTFVLVKLLTPVQAVFAASLVLFLALVIFCVKAQLPKIFKWIPVIFCFTAVIPLFFELKTLVTPGGAVSAYMETAYGRVMVTRQNDEYNLVTDGTPLFSTKNTAMAEEAVHYPLAQLKKVNRLLVISGCSGMFNEIIKHQPAAIDYIELDKAVSDALLDFGFLKAIPGLTVINSDAVSYLKTTRHRYSAIIVNLPEPSTFQLNRFYTKEFFSLVKSHLEPGGVFSFSLDPLPIDMPPVETKKLSIIKSTLKLSFNTILLVPAQNFFFLSSDRHLSYKIPELLLEKKVDTIFVNNFYTGIVTKFKIDRTARAINDHEIVNSNYRPVLVSLMFKKWFDTYDTTLAWFAVPVTLVFLVYFFFAGPMERVLFTTGASLMGIENLVILSYQISFGNIYNKIGLVITLFLFGLIPGALTGILLQKNRPGRISQIIGSDLVLALLALVFPAVVIYSGSVSKEILHLLFGFIFSAVCAYQIPVVFKIKGEGNFSISSIFTSDLAGASLAPLLFTLVMVPIFGILWTCTAVCFLKLSSAILVGLTHGRTV